MQVFKTTLKLIKKYLPIILMYLVIFTVISVILTNVYAGSGTQYEDDNVKVSVIDRDGGELSAGLVTYLQKQTDFVELADDARAMEDALFFREAECILIIPQGFSEAFFTEQPLLIDKMVVAGSVYEVQAGMKADRFLNTVRAYRNSTQLPLAAILTRTAQDLAQRAEVEMVQAGVSAKVASMGTFFNWQVYALLCVFCYAIGSVMASYNDRALNMRCNCGSVPMRKVLRQRYLAYFLLAFVVVVIMLVISFCFNPGVMASTRGGWFILNELALSVVLMSLAFLIGTVVRGDLVLNAVVNTVGLGMSFLSGVFVPQFMLSSGVLTVAHFLPGYWFVATNNLLSETAVFTSPMYLEMLGNMGIMLLFAVALVAVTVLVNRLKRRER